MAFDPNDAADKAIVAKAVKEAVDEAVTGLQTKNTELLGKLKKAQKDATIDPADHAALQAELDDVQTKLATALKDAKTATKAAEDAKKALEGESKANHNLVIDQALTAGLVKIGVKTPGRLKAAKAMLKDEFEVVAEGETRVAKSKVGSKSIEEFLSDWGNSEDGLSLVDAPVNSGGGAGGGGTGAEGGQFEKIADPQARLGAINQAGAAT